MVSPSGEIRVWESMSLALSSSNRFQTLYLELGERDRADRIMRLDVRSLNHVGLELTPGPKLRSYDNELLRLPDHCDGVSRQGSPATTAAHAFRRFLGSRKPGHFPAGGRARQDRRCRSQRWGNVLVVRQHRAEVELVGRRTKGEAEDPVGDASS